MKLISTMSTDSAFILNVNIPQDGEPFTLTFAAMMYPRKGWFTSMRIGSGEVKSKRFNRTPGEWLRDEVVYRWRRIKLALDPRPVYVWYENYWMVDLCSTYGVERLSCGLAYLRWRDRQINGQDENRFSCQRIDREAYESARKDEWAD